jgi:hypothetical protein
MKMTTISMAADDVSVSLTEEFVPNATCLVARGHIRVTQGALTGLSLHGFRFHDKDNHVTVEPPPMLVRYVDTPLWTRLRRILLNAYELLERTEQQNQQRRSRAAEKAWQTRRARAARRGTA